MNYEVVPTSDIDPSGSRICPLLLLFNIDIRPTFSSPVFWIVHSVSLSTRAYPLSPPISSVNTASLSLCTRFLPLPLSPSRRATVHLDGDPARQPPLLICTSLLCRPAQMSSLRELCLPSPFRLLSLAVLELCPGPCQPQGSPVQGSLHPSVVSINLTAAPPPLFRPLPAAQ